MSQQRCPNCRAMRPDNEAPCRQCGWMPLRPSELLYIDGHTVTCPNCSHARAATDERCPRCGSSGVLEPPSPHVANFHTSSLLLLATVIALCFALCRLSLAVGLPAFVLVGFATFRTCLLVLERKRHRYPHSLKDLSSMFGSSMIGIVVSSVVFIAAAAIAYMLAGAFLAPLFGPWLTTQDALLLVIPTALSSGLAVFTVVGRRKERQQVVALGAAVTLGHGLVSIALSRFHVFSGLVMLLWALAMCATALTLACWRGAGARIRSFLVGCSCSLCILQVVALIWARSRFEMSVSFGALAILLWPLLLAVMALERIWSWDDAFPRINHQLHTAPFNPRPSQLLIIDDDQPITTEKPS